jgi:tryptophan halogenase
LILDEAQTPGYSSSVLADLHPLEQIRTGMDLRREEVMRSAQAVSSHRDFIERNCAAPKR